MLNLKFIFLFFGLFCLFIITLTVFPYYLVFNETSISTETYIWGAFGDYFGGILNPILSIVNIGVLIYLTYLVNERDSKRAESELKLQKIIALYSLKHDALKDFNLLFSKIQPELVESNERSALNIILFRNDFNSLLETYEYLFPSIVNENYSDLSDSMVDISEIAEKRHKSRETMDIQTEIKPKLEEFQVLKMEFLKRLQKDIFPD